MGNQVRGEDQGGSVLCGCSALPWLSTDSNALSGEALAILLCKGGLIQLTYQSQGL